MEFWESSRMNKRTDPVFERNIFLRKPTKQKQLQSQTRRSSKEVCVIVFFSSSSFSFSCTGLMNGSKMERSKEGVHQTSNRPNISHISISQMHHIHQISKFPNYPEYTVKVSRDVGIPRYTIIIGTISGPHKTAFSPFFVSCLRISSQTR